MLSRFKYQNFSCHKSVYFALKKKNVINKTESKFVYVDYTKYHLFIGNLILPFTIISIQLYIECLIELFNHKS